MTRGSVVLDESCFVDFYWLEGRSGLLIWGENKIEDELEPELESGSGSESDPTRRPDPI